MSERLCRYLMYSEVRRFSVNDNGSSLSLHVFNMPCGPVERVEIEATTCTVRIKGVKRNIRRQQLLSMLVGSSSGENQYFQQNLQDFE